MPQMGPQDRLPAGTHAYYARNAMGPPHVSFSVSYLSLSVVYLCWCYGFLISDFGYHFACSLLLWPQPF